MRFELPNTICLPLGKDIPDKSETIFSGFSFTAEIQAPSALVSVTSSVEVKTQLDHDRATISFASPEVGKQFDITLHYKSWLIHFGWRWKWINKTKFSLLLKRQ